jgi:hypothetical protein
MDKQSTAANFWNALNHRRRASAHLWTLGGDGDRRDVSSIRGGRLSPARKSKSGQTAPRPEQSNAGPKGRERRSIGGSSTVRKVRSAYATLGAPSGERRDC